MLLSIHPKLPMRKINSTKEYYINQLDFQLVGEYENYLIVEKDAIQIHFFLFEDLDPKENYGQVYIRTNEIDQYYETLIEKQITIHPNGKLETKSWGQKEFSLLDPDYNLLTFGGNS